MPNNEIAINPNMGHNHRNPYGGSVPRMSKGQYSPNVLTVDTEDPDNLENNRILKVGPKAYPEAAIGQLFNLSSTLLGGATRVSPVPINGTTLGSGVAAGGLGALNNQDIILTIERPIRYQPYDYSKLVGYPTDKAVRLGSLEGFCVISKCHLRCAATLQEQNMIMEEFRQGVIF